MREPWESIRVDPKTWNDLCWMLRIPIDSNAKDIERAIQKLLDESFLLAESLGMAYRGDIEYVDNKVFETRGMKDLDASGRFK